MRFVFYSENHFGTWDWNAVDTGIGGSETSHIELAWRLRQRGHDVVSYAPVPFKGEREHQGVLWSDYRRADFSLPGVWILYRVPHVLDKFKTKTPEQKVWLMCQDIGYGPALTTERIGILDRLLVLCRAHWDYMARLYPSVQKKLWLTSNGIRVDVMRTLEARERNPKKLIYASSPDRGLKNLLRIFSRAREIEPELTLDVFYGFDNIDAVKKRKDSWARQLQKSKQEILTLADQPGVHMRGRIGQRALMQEWLSTGIWCYPTMFWETSCITAMEAQALGAVPITAPIWALRDNVAHGIWIDGWVDQDPLVRARYAAEIAGMAQRPERQDEIRLVMQAWAQAQFNWERVVDQWESELLLGRVVYSQYVYQHKHATGRILNVGAADDASGFSILRGAVNLDVIQQSPGVELKHRYHVLHDARLPFPECLGGFDTVILGDILEHVPDDEWELILANCRDVLLTSGRLIITCPDDDRSPEEQGRGEPAMYADRITAYHTRRISRETIEAHLLNTGYELVDYQPLDYSFATGHAVVARPTRDGLVIEERSAAHALP